MGNGMAPEDRKFLLLAIKKAEESVAQGGFPAGAIVVKDEKVIGEGISNGRSLNDPTSHGEIASIRDACKTLSIADLSNAILYASLQPCLMCFGASMWGGIRKIVYACGREKVSPEYYGGHYMISAINADLIRPVELLHDVGLEAASLAVIREWEKSKL
jgi:tRNA(Arg) A34 adenosine deaminase TadA